MFNMAHLFTPTILAFTVASLFVAGTYLYTKLHYRRFKQNAHIPQLPSSLLWGHLKLFDELTKRGIVDRHPGESSQCTKAATTAMANTSKS